MSFYFDDSDEIGTRNSLVKYYSSESITHGTFILTTVIGLFAFFQAKKELETMLTMIPPKILSSLVLGFLLSLLVYFTIKAIFWGTISSYALHVLPKKSEEIPGNALYRLHVSCLCYFKKHHPFINFLVGPGRPTLLNVFFYFVIALLIASAECFIFFI
jgi:hypothetical protein